MNDHAAPPRRNRRGLTRSKRTTAVSIALFLIAGGAFAWFSASGIGDGSVSAGDTLPLTVNQSTSVLSLLPGAPAVTLSGTFDNPNDAPVHVGSVTATVSSVKTIGGVDITDDCASDFTVGGTATVNANVDTGDTWTGLTVRLLDSGLDQDACKNAVVSLAYSAS